MSIFPEDFDPHDVDFDALYQGGQLVEGVDLPSVPWDIGAAQPVVIEAERAGRFHGAVLDVGCGLGDNALHLAGQGHQVTGIDAAPTAVEQARQRARQRGVDVEFAVADATSLAGFEGRFDSVLDGACYHCLDEDARHAYAAALHRATRPDALLTLFCFPAGSSGLAATMGISEENLRTTWGKAGWDIADLRPATYHVNADAGELVTAMGFECEPVPGEAGRLQAPVWALQARRA
ncbi:MAG TPA: class I SAM-dependent methyltransferase [Acidimicrobiia bacterium]|nr:class I SAM-dependent methyltransferase [Acidimicrobiia bacterium]